jgi:hypothetical protein
VNIVLFLIGFLINVEHVQFYGTDLVYGTVGE